MTRILAAVALVSILAASAACGHGEPVTQAGCTGSTCSCAAAIGNVCQFDSTVCGPTGSCVISCAAKTHCAGTCDKGCNINCADGARCEATVGNDATVSCAANSTCQITCKSKCMITCGAGAKCEFACWNHGLEGVAPNGTASCSSVN